MTASGAHDHSSVSSDAPASPGAPGLKLSTEQEGDVTVVAVGGEVDLLTGTQLADAVAKALEGRPRALVVDLSEVGFLASTGLATLVQAQQDAEQAGCLLRVIATGPATERPIRLTALEAKLGLCSDRDEAFRSL